MSGLLIFPTHTSHIRHTHVTNVTHTSQEQAAEMKFFDDWRQKFMAHLKKRKSRVMEIFKDGDSDHSGRLTVDQFSKKIMNFRE